jgi:hypothetical protein
VRCCGLVHPQRGLRELHVCDFGVPAQRRVEFLDACAEEPRRLLAREVRRTVRAGLRDKPLLHGQLHPRGVPRAAVTLEDAPAVRADEITWDRHRLRGFQARNVLEFGSQRTVGQLV